MPPKRGNQKPKGAGKPNRKNRPVQKEKVYIDMRDKQTQRWRDEAPRGRAKFQTQGQGPRGMMGNATLVRQPKIGMVDLMSHRVSWICGSVYIGNGTLGATNSVYFLDATGTYTNPYPVPIAGSDTLVGASYVLALEKLYRRKRYRKVRVLFLATQSSTTNNMTLTVAPLRGPPGAGETGGAGTSTAPAIAQATAMSLTGAETVDSFEDACLDLTPYIAGGSGAPQNEFAISNTGANDSALRTVTNLLGVSPSAFIVAGNSTVSALQGTNTHQVVIETVVDYLDFVGAQTVIDPEGLAAWPAVRGQAAAKETRDEKRARLLSELSAVAREDTVDRDRSRSKGKGEAPQ